MKTKPPLDLLDMIEKEERKEQTGAACAHLRESRTETRWPGEDIFRMTMTCNECGRIRGRYPNE